MLTISVSGDCLCAQVFLLIRLCMSLSPIFGYWVFHYEKKRWQNIWDTIQGSTTCLKSKTSLHRETTEHDGDPIGVEINLVIRLEVIFFVIWMLSCSRILRIMIMVSLILCICKSLFKGLQNNVFISWLYEFDISYCFGIGMPLFLWAWGSLRSLGTGMLWSVFLY